MNSGTKKCYYCNESSKVICGFTVLAYCDNHIAARIGLIVIIMELREIIKILRKK